MKFTKLHIHISRENKIIGLCLKRIASDIKSLKSKLAYELFEWFEDELGAEFQDQYHSFPGAQTDRKYLLSDWQILLDVLEEFTAAQMQCQNDFIDHNIQLLASIAGLNAKESIFIDILLRMNANSDFDNFCDKLLDDYKFKGNRALIYLTGLDERSIIELTSLSSRLYSHGIIENHSRSFRDKYWFALSSPFKEIFTQPLKDKTHILAFLAKKAGPSETELSDFSHLGQDVLITRRLIKSALTKSTNGMNVLIYGPPGSGKTEFVTILAESLDVQLYKIAETVEHDEPSRHDRIKALGVCQRLTQGDNSIMFLFDEMEDINYGDNILGGRQKASKVFMNRLLETNAKPVIWISNDIGQFDEAFIRRFTFSMKMGKPPACVNEKIWGRIHDKYQPAFDKKSLAPIIHENHIQPAHIDNAMQAVKLIEGDTETLRYILKNQSKALKTRREKTVDIKNFNINLIQSERDLRMLTKKMQQVKNHHLSLCISGPPGTGKSAYGRHLADKIGLPVLQKRASDLMDMYVGGTEKQIARAFEEACDTNSFLIFDEADSLLANRVSAHRNWEISQVNEMLTQMETHPLPFLATTNLRSHLDPASIRRFTFKLEFKSLEPQKLSKAFEHFFKTSAPDSLFYLNNLTPGDFHLVKKRCDILGLKDIDKICVELTAESRAKGPNRTPIGFSLTA